MPKINQAEAPRGSGTRYPAPFDIPCRNRSWLRLGDAAGLTQFGVNLLRLSPGAWSSQRHWHSHEDEFVYVLQGEVTLVTDQGEEKLGAGDCAGFKAGDRNGHCLRNLTQHDARILVIGSRHEEDHGEYPDIDMMFTSILDAARGEFVHKDGTPY
ncbi:MAG: cupin domain-containing protein [Steroidobacterales bacterium]